MNRKSFAILCTVATAATLVVSTLTVNAQPPTCGGQAATIVGTGGDDIIQGTNRRDVIVAMGGSDQILAGGGNDIICAGPGSDKIFGQGGNDRIWGEGGNDLIRGGRKADMIVGGPGNDRILGGLGNDTLIGSVGVDKLWGNDGADTCTADTRDLEVAGCENSNGLQYSGSGDTVVDVSIPSSLIVAEHCFPFVARCDKFTVARIRIDGSRSFDALSVQAYAADGRQIASYGNASDVFEGVFLFSDVPAVLEFDSGGGTWSAMFFGASALPSAPSSSMSGKGNDVYRTRRPINGLVEANAEWDGYGNFAVIGVSPTEGRDLILNEVHFKGRDVSPFEASAVAKGGITLVQVIADEGSWTVEFSK